MLYPIEDIPMISNIDVRTFIAMLFTCMVSRFAYPSSRMCAPEVSAARDRGRTIGKVKKINGKTITTGEF
jgi:hypothetical protein